MNNKLQIFYEADGGLSGGTTAPAPSTPSTEPTMNPQPAAQTQPAQPAQPAQQQQAAPAGNAQQPASNTTPATENTQEKPGMLKLVVDERTGRKTIRRVQPEEEAQANQQQAQQQQEQEQQGLTDNQPGAQQQQQQPVLQQKQPYTAQDLALALQLGNVDESRLTPDLALEYGAYKARQEFAQRQAQAQEQNGQNNNANQQSQQMKDFYIRVDKMANEAAMKELGLTADDIEAAEYSDDEELVGKVNALNTAKELNRQKIIAEVQQRQAQAQAQEQSKKIVYNNINNYVGQVKNQEPNFDKIDSMMATYYQQLPYESAVKYASVIEAFKNGNITQEQTAVLEEYYKETRKAYYAQASGLSQVPQPVNKPRTVEPAGGGADVPHVANPADLRNMSLRDKREWFKQNMGHR